MYIGRNWNFLYVKKYLGLKRWLRVLAALEKTQVRFPEPIWWLITSVIPVPGDLRHPLLTSAGTWPACDIHTHT